MAKTQSTMLDLGTTAPSFSLPCAVTGKTVSLSDFSNRRALLVMFLCNHCPFVKHIRDPLAETVSRWQNAGLAAVGISSNDVSTHPQDGPELMKREAEEAGYTFPYLFDSTQEVAKAYRAACTPDFFLFDGRLRLVYRGQFDGSRPGNRIEVTGADLDRAVNAVLAGTPLMGEQRPSLGCNIKWRAGNEPDYYRG